MNRSVGKTLTLLAPIMASLWASVAFAELSATVDRREIAMGEDAIRKRRPRRAPSSDRPG